MKFKLGIGAAFLGILLVSINCFAQKPIAFPGAEGFGKYTTGGRGGKTYIVTNLEDDGEGSFRKAVSGKEPRIVTFAVSGTIHLKSKLFLKSNLTIAGQTAPGDGICLADYPVSLNGNNIIVRYLRFRMGDRFQNTGMVDGAGADDAFGGSRRKNIIVDHCSITWSTDEVCSIYGGDSTTLQWNILAEPLNYSYHFETGDKDFEHHGYGGIWGGEHLSAHHNIFVTCNSRNPRFNGTRLGANVEFVDFRNNVIYNWGHNSVYGGENGKYNMVANYYKSGPNTNKSVKNRIVNPSFSKEVGFGKFYVSKNEVDGYPDVSADNSIGVQFDKGFLDTDKLKVLVKVPFEAEVMPTVSAKQAYDEVLKFGGANLPVRDTLDQRILNNVKMGTGKSIDVQGDFPHGTPYEVSKVAWPDLKSKPALKDADADGMPDDWEIKNHLNAQINDSVDHTLNKDYTNIEVYLNFLVQKNN
jgi:hypothetical protein